MATAIITKEMLLNSEMLDKYLPTSAVVGGHKLEIRSFKEMAGHDDSVPYQAKIHIDGKEGGVCYNDGWGGETEIQVTKEQAYPAVNEMRLYIRDHREEFPIGEYDGHVIHALTLADLCDTLALNLASRRDALKKADKALVLFNPKTGGISTVSFTKRKSIKLSELVDQPQFRTLWQNAIEKYETKGYIVLSVKDIFYLYGRVA